MTKKFEERDLGGLRKEIARLVGEVRESKPLVHHITNWVVTNFTANGTLAMGALPVMAHAAEEVADMAKLASALVLNIGTLTPSLIEAMLVAGKSANEKGIPVILDPVGAGATKLRTESALRLLDQVQVAVVRGNAGELAALCGVESEVRGVESISAGVGPAELARKAAGLFGVVAAVTGAVDWISDGRSLISVANGHPMLSTVTGTGCLSTTAVAVYCSRTKDYLLGAAAGLTVLGLAAEIAAPAADGPGTFQAHLLDALYHMDAEKIKTGAKVQYETTR